METTRLSSKGQVIIPKNYRKSHHWEPGMELEVFDAGDGLLLKPRIPFPETSLEEVAGCLKRDRAPLSPEEMEAALRKGARKAWRDRP